MVVVVVVVDFNFRQVIPSAIYRLISQGVLHTTGYIQQQEKEKRKRHKHNHDYTNTSTAILIQARKQKTSHAPSNKHTDKYKKQPKINKNKKRNLQIAPETGCKIQAHVVHERRVL